MLFIFASEKADSPCERLLIYTHVSFQRPFSVLEVEVAIPVMKRMMKTAERKEERMRAVARMQTSCERRVCDLRRSVISASKGVTCCEGHT